MTSNDVMAPAWTYANTQLAEHGRLFLADFLGSISCSEQSLWVRNLCDIGKAICTSDGTVEIEIHSSHERSLSDAQLLEALRSKLSSYVVSTQNYIEELKKYELVLLYKIMNCNHELQILSCKFNLKMENLCLNWQQICTVPGIINPARFENEKKRIMAEALQDELNLFEKMNNLEFELRKTRSEYVRKSRNLSFCIARVRYLTKKKAYIVTVSKR